ncbi:hypothetical protein [Streptomyces yaizuensis]|uniref:Uncharacterized protein n=1 Tax=Streptomyces yaizuensis TaxID=2989713 RepID=A0ABQ5P727_9ACTN|nr:hypothetical protein [Streptomyces sp. YSPA8]GLF98400.1 hypothetical protein SYYSPA8_28905 [Streptomyces sp. YSPA8]
MNRLAHIDEGAADALRPLLGDTTMMAVILRDLRITADLLLALHNSDTTHTSLGIHPDERHGACVSFLSLSITRIAHRTPQMAVAQCALAQRESPLWQEAAGRLISLPDGTPAALVSGTLTAPPNHSSQALGVSMPSAEVFQARLTVPFPSREHVAVADLTTAAVHHSSSYSSILEGIAQTMSFSDPGELQQQPQRYSRLRELF